MVFCGALFDVHPRYQHFKTLMIDFFRGQLVESMEIVIRSKKVVGSKVPKIDLEEMGPG